MTQAVPGVVSGENPFAVKPSDEMLHDPPDGAEGWSETVFFSVWSPRDQVGVMIHAGTDPIDPSLWWAQVFAYLPGERLVADRSWGRARDPRGPVTGSLAVSCTEPMKHWTLQFDGAGESTTSRLAALGVVGAGPAVPLAFAIDVEAIAPVWDLYGALGGGAHDFGSLHHEQNLLATGTLTAAGRTWSIDGVAFRDHSAGLRNFEKVGGDRFWGLVSPTTGTSVQGLMVWDRDGSPILRTASIHDNGRLEICPEVMMTGIRDTAGNPRELEMTIVRRSGEQLVVPGRRLHGTTISILDPNTNVNGTVREGDPLVLSEAPVRFQWPDGDELFGSVERSWRLSGLEIGG